MIRITLGELLSLNEKLYNSNDGAQKVEFTQKEKQLILDIYINDPEPLFDIDDLYNALVSIQNNSKDSSINHNTRLSKYLIDHKEVVEIFFHLASKYHLDDSLCHSIITALFTSIAILSKDKEDAVSKLIKISDVDCQKIAMVMYQLTDDNFYKLDHEVITFYIKEIANALETDVTTVMIPTINNIKTAITFNLNHTDIASRKIKLKDAIDNYNYPGIIIDEKGQYIIQEQSPILRNEEIKDKKFLHYILRNSKKYGIDMYDLQGALQQVPKFLQQNDKKLVKYLPDHRLYLLTHKTKKYTTQLLSNDDPTGLFIGKKTNACILVGGFGMDDIVIPAYTSPWSGYMVVYKGKNDIHAAAYMWMAKDEITEKPLGLVVNSYESIHLNKKIFIKWLIEFSAYLHKQGLKLYFGYHAGQTPNFKIIDIHTKKETNFYDLAPIPHPKPMDNDLPIYDLDVSNVVEVPVDNVEYKALTAEEEVIHNDFSDFVTLYQMAKYLKQKYKAIVSSDVYHLQDKIIDYFVIVEDIIKNNQQKLGLLNKDIELWELPSINTCTARGIDWEDSENYFEQFIATILTNEFKATEIVGEDLPSAAHCYTLDTPTHG